MFRVFSIILFIPHLLIFFFSEKRKIIIDDLYSRLEVKPQNFNTILCDLAVKLFKDRYFRTLFYFRIGGITGKLLRVFFPRDRYFIIDIHTKMGAGVRLGHPYSTIINADSIGDHLYINHLVTVGEKNGRKPKMGNNVQLHANCSVIGGIKIGDNAIIGAGAVVTKDVPANSIAVGNPARIIYK